jgi:hypothetical protein
MTHVRSVLLVLLFFLLFVLPLISLAAEFLLVGLEVGPDLRDHGEGVVHLLLEICVFILELVAF